MELIHRLKQQGAEIQSFISHCGGLIAPENDNNPWHYKISWNPRNIVLAGAAGAVYKLDGSVVEKKYPEIFENCKSLIIPDFSNYVWYPNRDSMSYIPLYQLEKADTFIRTTIRHKEFCEGWDILIGLGLTNPTDRDELSGIQNFHDWIAIKLKKVSTATSLSSYLENYPRNIVEQIEYLELDRKELLPRSLMSSADILQWIIERKLALGEGDRDMIIMQHEISYSLNQQNKTIRSTLVVKGENQERTAMSKTVGLPLGIAAKLILEGKIRITGLKIPIESAIYEPVLEELKLSGIAFHETII
jgi:saccharopine dehydrogenase (NADP+, L-glutamate forming)